MYALKTVQKIAAAAALVGLVAALMPTLAAAESGPSVVLSSTSTQAPGSTNDNPILVTASVSSSTSDFIASDVSVSGGSVSNFSGSGQTYTFDVTPGDGDINHANQPRTVTVAVNGGAFDDNVASNELTFNYAATAPALTITGPNGATSNNATVTIPSDASTTPVEFTFTTDDSGAIFTCWVGDASTTPSPWSCGSPQDYSLGADSSYVFQVTASNDVGTTTSTVDFSVVEGTSTATSTGSGDTDTNVPVIDMTGGPSDGSTVNPADAVFTWTVDDASSTVQCSIEAASSTASFTGCTSPQDFSSYSDGAYQFTVEATNDAGTASTTVNFTVSSTTPASGSSSSGTSGSSSSSSSNGQTTAPGSGGGSQPVGSSPTAPSNAGIGNNGSLGTSDVHTVIPTFAASDSGSGNAVIPTAPVTTTQTTAPGSGTTAPAPVVSQSSGGSALVGSNAPSTATTVTPGVPNTGGVSSSSTSTASTSVYQPLGVASATPLTAAAANSGGGIPVWVWFVIAGIVIIGVGVWALQQPA